MTPTDLRHFLAVQGWTVVHFARVVGLSPDQVHKYLASYTPIPRRVELIIRAIQEGFDAEIH